MNTNQAFELVQEKEIPEFHSHGKLYRHIKTNARLLSIINEDENKVFGINFRTPPTDSTGISHIMEHSVLCGSRKYPVKEPFVELLKGSLKTFLNAFTYPDKTCYPVASQNLQDFYNLIDVYLDAVFYPKISQHVFDQEGWHYELEKLEDPLKFKGVVFNEMKGAYSAPDRVLCEYAQQSLFPDNTYGFESGGHPRHITDLTFQQFKDFHKMYYHPSNSYIYFYGDDDPEQRLAIAEEYLQDFDKKNIDSQVRLQTTIDQPKTVEYTYDSGNAEDSDRKGMIAINWLLSEVTDLEMRMSFRILEHILIGTPASPLRKALIDSGLGEDISGVGLENELRQMYFSTGLKGISLQDAKKIESLIIQTLADLAKNGIEPDTIEASINTIEFSLRENNTGSFPRGLSLMLRSLTAWLYDADPFLPLRFEQILSKIKNSLKEDNQYFEKLIDLHLLQNKHRTSVILKPDPGQGKKEEELELNKLKNAQQSKSKEELQEIINNTENLKNIQVTPDPPEALASIPSLQLSDLNKEIKKIPCEISRTGNTEIIFHDIFTSQITYVAIGFNLHVLPQEFLPYISLLSSSLLEVGTEKEDFVKLTQRIGRKTGGIACSTFCGNKVDSHQKEAGKSDCAAWMFLKGKVMVDQVDDLLDIFKDVLLTTRLDNQVRFQQILLEEKAEMESDLIPSGHQVINSRLRSRFSEGDWADEQMTGIEYLNFVRKLIPLADSNWPLILSKLEEAKSILLNRNCMTCNITIDQKNWEKLQPKLKTFINLFPDKPVQLQQWTKEEDFKGEGFTIPSQVNYVGKGANLYKFGYQLHGSTMPITRYLATTWLWERVRVQGGAYGGFCRFDPHSGVFTFLSYRDPNLLETLDTYDNTSKFLKELDLNETELTRSIVGAIGDMDTYQLPPAKGFTSLVRHLIGLTDDRRQKIRDEVFNTSVENFKEFATILDKVNEEGDIVALGSEEAITKANQERDNFLSVTKIL